MCSASLGPTSYVDFPDGGFGSISAINVELCTEQCQYCCSQTSPVGSGYSFSTQWQNADNAYTRMSTSSNDSLTLQGINPGSFGITAFVTQGSCQSPPMNGGGTVQVPTSLPIVRTINAAPPTTCSAGQSGWDRNVIRQVRDQNGTSITTANQFIDEAVAIGPGPNGLNLTPKTHPANTDAEGEIIDEFSFCTPACPASQLTTEFTQTVADTPAGKGNGSTYPLGQYDILYSCSSVKVNGSLTQ